MPLLSLLVRIDETEYAMRELVTETKTEVANLKSLFVSVIREIADREDDLTRQDLARHLVMYHASVPVRVIAEAFGFIGSRAVYDLNEWLGETELNKNCESCGFQLKVKSRTEFEYYFKKNESERTAPPGFINRDSLLCKNCEDGLEKKRREARVAQDRKIEGERSWRIAVLQKMPYKEYLQTPEWNEVRTDALKRASYRCQVCNANKTTLDVHHRTYERRGEERANDIIVLCRDCHGTFHRNRKLAQ